VDLASMLSELRNLTPLDCLPDAWHWWLAPGFDFTGALSRDGKHLFQAYALRSYDEDLACAMLSFAREHDAELIGPPERPLTLAEGFAHSPFKFDTVVAIGPTVHKYQKENPELHDVTRAPLPAFRCEFAGDESEEETQFRYGRAAGVPATNWNREPHPFLKVRFRVETGRVIDERGFAHPVTLWNEMRALEGRPEGFFEIENYRREVWRVEWADGWLVGGDSAPSGQLGIDELMQLVKAFLYGPNLDAGTSWFDKAATGF
jgi:hypothetical protein